MPEEEFLHVALYDVRGSLRSVLTEEFAGQQEGTLHFQHLRSANGGLLTVGATLAELRVEFLQISLQLPDSDGLTQLCHQRLIKREVVDGIELSAEHFTAAIQMVQIGAGEIAAGITAASDIQRTHIVAVDGVADFHHTRAGE